MSFTQTNILTTRDFALDQRWLGQIAAVPTGRLDKVSLYLEPFVSDLTVASNATVVVEVRQLFGTTPTNIVYAFDSKPLSDIAFGAFYNFRIEATVPTTVAIVVHQIGGDAQNYVNWRYVKAPSGGEEMLISQDGGTTWVADPTKKFTYRAFSLIQGAVDPDEQTALIRPGTLAALTDDTGAEFSLAALTRTAVVGDTVAIDFGNFVVTFVVDQSGSMTWNDHDGLRFQFIKDFVADLEASLPSGSTASYSLLKFRGRKVSNISLQVEGSSTSGFTFDGVRIVRKTGSPPVDPTDGCVVFEGVAQDVIDDGVCAPLSAGTPYYYAAFSFAEFANGTTVLYSTSRLDFAVPGSPPAAPFATAGLRGSAVACDNTGVPLVTGATDFGFRRVNLAWANPTGFNYTTATLVRRDDRMPESPIDGTVLFSNQPASTVSYTDTFGGTYSFVNGINYFYKLFTSNSIDIKCIAENAQSVQVAIPSAPRPWEQVPGGTPPVGFPPPPPVLSPVATSKLGNGNIELDWSPGSGNTVRYKLFYRADRYPKASNDKGTEYDGDLLLDGTGTSFIHRFLQNGQPHFYVLIGMDIVENASPPLLVAAGNPAGPLKPSDTSTIYLPPDPVSNFAATTINASSIHLTWTNPSPPASDTSNFFFGDSINVIGTVTFADSGSPQLYQSFEFIELSRQVTNIDETDPVDPAIGIQFAQAPVLGAGSIAAVVSVTPLLAIQNKMADAQIKFTVALRVKNRITGELIAEVRGPDLTLKFTNPFVIDLVNDPQQNVSIRTWGPDPNNQDGEPCTNFLYQATAIPGVYCFSGDPFYLNVEATFRGAPLTAPLDVTLSVIDKATGLPSELVQIPQAQGQPSVTLTTTNVQDEELDRTGEPTGDTTTKSIIPLTLPPSNIPGEFIVQATATYQGYIQTASIEVHYEPILNIDLNLTPFQPDNVDRTEQSAFVYLAPFDAPDDLKVAVTDFTVTTWSIRPLCHSGVVRPLQSEDDVPGVGVKAFTRGGLATKIFWGPGGNVQDDQLYEVSVIAQANGMTGKGFGVVTLSPPVDNKLNRIFLRNPTNFYDDSIFSDGIAVSTWEVLARPEDEAGGNESGSAFHQAVTSLGGLVPDLPEGKIVTMTVKTKTNTQGTVGDVLDNVRIKTNLTGPKGKAKSANATIVNGKAVFEISVDAKVPKPDPNRKLNPAEVQANIVYQSLGINFNEPLSGISLILTVNTSIVINGSPIAFYGGGGDIVNSSPPAFIELIEPLDITS